MTAVTHEISARPGLAAVVALLESARLPTEDLTPRHCEHFFRAGPEAKPHGLVGLELFGEAALLRSLVVVDTGRNRGAGTALLAHAERHARERGVTRIYLLTTTAEGFFERRGYTRLARDAAPDAIRATREFSGICPASSVFMVKELRE
jgi:amino-acid N-acetyltransferase